MIHQWDEKHHSEQRPRQGLRDLWCVVLMLLLVAIFFRKTLFASSPVVLGSPLLVDLTHMGYPWRLFGFDMLKRGLIPLWNPYLFCGTPFLANWTAAIFYPVNLVFVFAPVHVTINCSFVVHVILCGVFIYMYMRCIIGDRLASLVSAITFMYSAPLLLRIFAGHLTPVCTMSWLPLELFLVERGLRRRKVIYFVTAGVVFAVQILAGYPQMVLYSGIAVLFYFCARMFIFTRQVEETKPVYFLSMCALLAIIACGLSAVQVLPSLEFIDHSSRASMTYRETAGTSFPPENVATLLVPELFGDFIRVRCWGRTYLWEAASYIGIIPLALALLAVCYRRNIYTALFAVIGGMFFVLALGGYTPMLKFLYYHVPGFNLIRGNAKAYIITAYCLSFLSGIGCKLLLDEPDAQPKARTRCCCLVIILLLLFLLFFVAFIYYPAVRSWCGNILMQCRRIFILEGDNPPEPHLGILFTMNLVTSMSAVYRSMIFISLAVIVFSLGIKRCGKGTLVGVLAVGITIIDLWSFGSRYVIVTPEEYCSWPRAIVQFFKRDGSIYRTLRDIRVPLPGVNQSMNDQIFSFEGYEANVTACYQEFVNFSGVKSEEAEMLMRRKDVSVMASLANIKYLILPPSAVSQNADYPLRLFNGYVKIFENRTVFPRAWIVHRYMVTGSLQIARELMRRKDYDPHTQVILDKDPEIAIPGASPGSSAEIVKYTPDEVVVKCRMGAPGILVLSDMYYPGWKVTIDNILAKILRANHAFRGVPVGKGTHEVRFTYEPASFRWGAAVSGATVVLIAAYYLVAVIRRKGHV